MFFTPEAYVTTLLAKFCDCLTFWKGGVVLWSMMGKKNATWDGGILKRPHIKETVWGREHLSEGMNYKYQKLISNTIILRGRVNLVPL